MTENTEHTERTGHADEAPWWHPRALATPTSSALAAFAIAFLTLDGQNLLLVGIQSVLGEGIMSSNQPGGFYLAWGLAALVPLLVVALLARITLGAGPRGWEAHLARAAVLVAAVAAVGAVLTALGGILHTPF
jgi:hypothetical protein